MTDSIREILEELKVCNAQLFVDGENLRIEAEKGIIDDRLKLLIKKHKEELVTYIRNIRDSSFSRIPVAAVQTAYSLSSSQQRLWILAQFEESNVAYNLPGAYLFEGSLDIAALEHAFGLLIARHEILRTTFKEDEEGEIRQFISGPEASGFSLSSVDLSNENDPEGKISQVMETEYMFPFDLARGPLLRAGLYRIADQQWIFLYAMHHIINDGWSMDILLRELLHFYDATISGKAAVLVPLRIQYKDYAVWQQEQLNGDALKEHKNYWLKRFEDAWPELHLLGDHVRPPERTYRGGIIRKTLDKELTTGLQQLVQEKGATLFIGLLSVVNALLYRYTGQEDIITGSLIAGRDHADLEDQIGFYVNTLALRTQFDGNEDSYKLIETVRQVAFDAYAHQVYPFDQLINDLNLKRDAARNPLFDVMVVLQNRSSGTGAQSVNGFTARKYEIADSTVSKFDLSFDFLEIEDELQLSLEYNGDLFMSRTAIQIAEHLEQLLSAMLKDPDKPICHLDYLSEAEKKELLITFNNTSEHEVLLETLAFFGE